MAEHIQVQGFDPIKENDGSIKIEIPVNAPKAESTPPQPTSSIWIFLSSVDWQEPWLMTLIGFHIICLCISLTGSRIKGLQIFLFMFLLGFTYLSENINEIAAKNWQKFSKQQYFDEKGMFISLVFSVPALINCCIITVMWLWESASLLIKVKRAELSRRGREAAAAAQQSDAPQEPTDHPKSD